MHAFGKLTKMEFRLLLREPVAAFFAIAFPAILVGILGCIPGFRDADSDLGGSSVIDLYVPIAIALGLAILGIQFTPATLANYRERGILRRLSTTPVRPAALLGAQVVASLVAIIIGAVLVLAVGRIAFGVALPRQFFGFVIAFLLSAGALFSIGLLIAAVAPSGKAGNAIGTVLFFPIMFFAGLWVPREAMSGVVRTIADYSPLGAGERALHAASIGQMPGVAPLAALVVYIVIFGLAAAKLFTWE
jgi:ABC-2 type transport system permease protein